MFPADEQHGFSFPAPGSVRIYEVAPRDGLQNEADIVSTADKLGLIERLLESGVRDIEVTSFVRPSWIPQLADAADLVAALPQLRQAFPDARFWALVPNRRGLERALAGGVQHICTFMSASETHNKKNVNRTRAESLAALEDVIGIAKDEGLAVRAYLSTVFGCPYEGEVAVDATLELSHALLEAGADELALGDTTGMGNPRQVVDIVSALTGSGVPLERIALHMHDTRGTALANVLAGWQAGVRTFDGSVGGLGGCPYAPGAAGNASTDDLVQMFAGMSEDTGINLEGLADAGHFLAGVLGRPLPGRFHAFHAGKKEAAARKAARAAAAAASEPVDADRTSA